MAAGPRSPPPRARRQMPQVQLRPRGAGGGGEVSGVWEQGGTRMKPHPRIRKTIKWGCAEGDRIAGGGMAFQRFLLCRVGSQEWLRSLDRTWRDSPVRVEGPKRGQRRSAVSCLSSIDSMLNRESGGGRSAFSFIGWQAAWPIWPLAVVSLAATVVGWRLDARGRRKRARVGQNLCPNCSYDRAGLGLGAKCPECGRPPA